MSRHIIVPTSNNPAVPSVDEKANSDTDAFQYGFAGNIGYEFNVRQFTITPVARVQYVKADVEQLRRERREPGQSQGWQPGREVADHQPRLESRICVQHAIRRASSRTIRAEYVHEFENDDDGAKIQYASDPTGMSAFNVIIEGTE